MEIYEVTMLEAIIVKQNKLNQCSLSLAKADPSIAWASLMYIFSLKVSVSQYLLK